LFRSVSVAAVAVSCAMLMAACSGHPARPAAQPGSAPAPASSAASAPATSSPAPRRTTTSPAAPATRRPVRSHPAPSYCPDGGAALWANLAGCGWPGPASTGPDLSQCPGGRLTPDSGSLTRTIVIRTPGTVIRCENITGMLDIQAQNVTVEDSSIESNSGRTGEAANGTADIKIEDGASATIEHVRINGDDGVHACIWHQGTRMLVDAVDCYGADDGIWSWADNGYSPTTGDNFVIENSYFHGFTTATSNGHEDGYQTEGASYGLVEHNTYQMTAAADSAIAIWDSLRDSHDITVRDNLITGGGFAIYAEDYSPGDGGPGDPSAVGGYTVTDISFTDNVFSTHASGCVGQFGVWFSRPTWAPYDGGPTDGWHRSGNRVLGSRQHIDSGNPSDHGSLCS
jgi:hypothetical protein